MLESQSESVTALGTRPGGGGADWGTSGISCGADCECAMWTAGCRAWGRGAVSPRARWGARCAAAAGAACVGALGAKRPDERGPPAEKGPPATAPACGPGAEGRPPQAYAP